LAASALYLLAGDGAACRVRRGTEFSVAAAAFAPGGLPSARPPIKESAHLSIFGSIMSKVLGRTPAAPVTPAQAAPSAPAGQAGAGQAGTEPSSGQAAPSASPGPQVDVAAVLDELKSQNKAMQKLNWRLSIVDLMTLLSLDSSLAARKELAKELHYEGDTSDTYTMNIWLHKQIMKNLAANGGKLPDDLKSLI
jgi:Domain of unknown function (DUF3597)